jgi:hypothetical protein
MKKPVAIVVTRIFRARLLKFAPLFLPVIIHAQSNTTTNRLSAPMGLRIVSVGSQPAESGPPKVQSRLVGKVVKVEEPMIILELDPPDAAATNHVFEVALRNYRTMLLKAGDHIEAWAVPAGEVKVGPIILKVWDCRQTRIRARPG